MRIYIEVDQHWVKINGQKVLRPASVSPSQWLAYWGNGVKTEAYWRGYRDAEYGK